MQDGDGHDDDDDEGDGDDSDYDVHDCGDDADDDGDCVYGFLHSFIAKWRFTGGFFEHNFNKLSNTMHVKFGSLQRGRLRVGGLRMVVISVSAAGAPCVLVSLLFCRSDQ